MTIFGTKARSDFYTTAESTLGDIPGGVPEARHERLAFDLACMAMRVSGALSTADVDDIDLDYLTDKLSALLHELDKVNIFEQSETRRRAGSA